MNIKIIIGASIDTINNKYILKDVGVYCEKKYIKCCDECGNVVCKQLFRNIVNKLKS